MSEDTEDVVLEPELPVEEPKIEVVDKEGVSPDEGIEALKAKLTQEEAGRQAAEAAQQAAIQQRNEAIGRATEAHKARFESDLALVSQAAETLKSNQDQLEANLAASAAAGDWVEHAKFQRTMTENAAKLATLESGKEALEAKKNETPQIIQLDPVDAFASQLTPRSGAWVRAHPEYATDPAKYQRMLAAHNSATLLKGLTADTDEYFAAVETDLGLRQAPAAQAQTQESPLSEASTKQDAPPAAAPVRSNGSTRVTLTSAEREIAEMNNMTPEEYAAQKVALQKEGRIH